MAGNADAVCDVRLAMFAREYLSVVSRWAREQLRQEAQSSANRRHLRQLIEAAEALRVQLPARNRIEGENVIRLADHNRDKKLDRAERAKRTLSFLDT
jgi:hypothetical protein